MGSLTHLTAVSQQHLALLNTQMHNEVLAHACHNLFIKSAAIDTIVVCFSQLCKRDLFVAMIFHRDNFEFSAFFVDEHTHAAECLTEAKRHVGSN